ncbi:Lrp/AsnC ligand binding domain-containing protein [Govanella unica]|uniref:Lrp/AsnC ligand binding domain-containing protein n=1 Tax=Govanella unica TaxID=2975056 RepID=A0A9X3TWS3_9PROT|nr:Lrp/AsnC ligand binding domain-containing protein [Govania unica]MDA5193154.1 Lrp/AsnC ligand binding domain-containing protein [Govania unica]
MKDTKPLDRIDLNILRLLQTQGRISNVELAKEVGLSPTPCLERVRRLEREGFILDYRAILNPELLKASLIAFVEVTLERTTTADLDRFNAAILRLDEVMECHMVGGGFDYLVKIRLPGMDYYRRFLGEKLAAIPGVSQTHTYVVMEEVKAKTALPLG